MSKIAHLVDALTAAEMLGKSRSQINRMAAAGDIPVAWKGEGKRGAYLFDKAVVERIASARSEAVAS